jgi:hypothetical protein
MVGLHMTIQEIGFGDLAPDPDALATHFADVPSFECSLGPLNAFPDAVFAEVRPFDGPRALRRAARKALPGLDTAYGSPDRSPSEGGMAPHVSVAYFDAEVPTPQVASVISATTVEAILLHVTEVVLAAVERPTTECFRWNRLARFGLGP